MPMKSLGEPLLFMRANDFVRSVAVADAADTKSDAYAGTNVSVKVDKSAR